MNQKRYMPPVALAALFSAAALVSQPGSAQGVGGTRPPPAPAPAPTPSPAPAPVDIADRVGPDGYTPRNRPCPSYLPNCHDPVPLSLRFLPRIAEIPVGATSASQVVVKRSPSFLPNVLNDPSLPTMREIAKSDAKGRQYLNAVIPVLEAEKMLPNITDRPIIITMAALDLKGTMSQENPTSPPPTCPYGYASGPTWSGWQATGWQYVCNPAPWSPPPWSPPPAPAPAPSPAPAPAPAPSPSPAPAPAPSCSPLPTTACEGNDLVRRDTCGNVVDRWVNAPSCNYTPVMCPGTTYEIQWGGSWFVSLPSASVGTNLYGRVGTDETNYCDWGAGCAASGSWSFGYKCWSDGG